MKQAMQRATHVALLGAQLYRELAVSAFSLIPRRK